MENEAPYGVSYIASAPEELKVGDRVEVVDVSNGIERRFLHRQGRVSNPTTPDGSNPYPDKVWVDFNGEQIFYFSPSQLRKLPDTISFEDNPLDKQVGGSHYKDMAIQPVEFCMKNKLDFCTSSAIKYLCRHKNKNGKEDLLKAKHFIDLLIQLEYPDPDFENVE